MEYDFYTCCPIQGCENANKPIRWKHYNCGGYTKINDKGYIRCSKCNVKGKVVDWKFSCESHDFQEPNFQKLILMLTTLQQLMKINNDDFILDLSTKIKNQYKQKKNKFQQENKLPSDFEDESYDSDNYDLDESTLGDVEYTKTLQLALKDAINQNEKLNEKLYECFQENKKLKEEIEEKDNVIYELGQYYEFCQNHHLNNNTDCLESDDMNYKRSSKKKRNSRLGKIKKRNKYAEDSVSDNLYDK